MDKEINTNIPEKTAILYLAIMATMNGGEILVPQAVFDSLPAVFNLVGVINGDGDIVVQMREVSHG